MNIYFAPLEGITGHIYRNAYNDIFGVGIDKYFSPFISPGVNQILSRKEMRDIMPENNVGLNLVPQILASRAEDALLAIDNISEYGYTEFNINLGCPSGTVVAKRKGSGMLADLFQLEKFLDKIFEKTNYDISLKTRIGKDDYDDWDEIIGIYNKFPLKELIIHPRIQRDFYKNEPRMDAYEYAYKNCKCSLCYNGDIFTKASYDKVVSEYPSTDSVMLGRGILKNPFLPQIIGANEREQVAHKSKKHNDTMTSDTGGNDDIIRNKLLKFHDRLLEDYKNEMSGERPVLFKMYLGELFVDADKELKKIKKTEKLTVYTDTAREIIKNGGLCIS